MNDFARSRKLHSIFCALAILLCHASLPAQTRPAEPSGTALNDPTHAEAQPNLGADRDPILSPDAADNAPVSPAKPEAGLSPGELKKQQGDIYTLQRDVDEVLLNCTVVDEKGQLVKDLNQKDFQVFEDGVPQTIASFQHQDLPVSLGLIVDNSGSMRDKRPAVNAAALDLVRASNRDDSAFVVNFAEDAYIDQDFTSNISALERGLSHFDSRGSTALYDAVVASANELARHAQQPKQVLLIITDGEDNASRLTLDQAIRRVQQLGGPVVYSIGLLYEQDNKDKARNARAALEQLSEETGGIAYFPRSLDDVDAIAREVAHDIRNQYTIGYHSTKPTSSGGYRTVRVEAHAPGHGKLSVRTRHGYYPKENRQQNLQRAQTISAPQ